MRLLAFWRRVKSQWLIQNIMSATRAVRMTSTSKSATCAYVVPNISHTKHDMHETYMDIIFCLVRTHAEGAKVRRSKRGAFFNRIFASHKDGTTRYLGNSPSTSDLQLRWANSVRQRFSVLQRCHENEGRQCLDSTNMRIYVLYARTMRSTLDAHFVAQTKRSALGPVTPSYLLFIVVLLCSRFHASTLACVKCALQRHIFFSPFAVCLCSNIIMSLCIWGILYY